jgi:hypothetical protein
MEQGYADLPSAQNAIDLAHNKKRVPQERPTLRNSFAAFPAASNVA